MDVPGDRRYTDQHEWARLEGPGVRVGITDYAQHALGNIVYVDLPQVGRRVRAGEKIADVDSEKTYAEVYAPVSGVVLEVNDALVEYPDRHGQWALVNSDPYGEGWFLVLEADDPSALDALLDAAAYQALIG